MIRRLVRRIASAIRRQEYLPGVLGVYVNPYYFTRRGLYRSIRALAPELEGRVLDVGCGQKPYRSLFTHTREMVGLEIGRPEKHGGGSKADCFYDGRRMPFRDEEFDSVMATEVFEHVFHPNQFLSELRRVLKPKGHLLLTFPFVWDEHGQPHDFARYTSFGSRAILHEHGFEVQRLIKTVNDVRVVFQLWNCYVYKKVGGNNIFWNVLITLLLMTPFNFLGLLFGMLLPKNDDLYLNNVILARKEGPVPKGNSIASG